MSKQIIGKMVITFFSLGIKIKIGLLIFVLFLNEIIFSQTRNGRVVSEETNSGIGFVSIGIIGKNVGTISDSIGNFSIDIDKIYDKDSIRFSMIGYKPMTFLVSSFKGDPANTVYLKPMIYEMHEVKVVYRKSREVILGVPVTSGNLISGFAYNNPGAEMGIKANVKRQVKLMDINLNVSVCTFDSVTYRLNIYQLENNGGYQNILIRPVYLSFLKDKINKVVSFDLRKYSIVIEGTVLITLELFKDLGKGKLLFFSNFSDGTTLNRKASEGAWTVAPVVIGMYLHGQIIK